MISPYLAAERDRLLSAIHQIRSQGSPAPANVWISSYQKGAHTYYKLTSENKDCKTQHLGRLSSLKYQDWAGRIQRRNDIQELEQQLSWLTALIERQAKAKIFSLGEGTDVSQLGKGAAPWEPAIPPQSEYI
ncbi:hypothetical protein IFO70_20310 [Phormidium tenue FACHB-886]|nr:hypothetical protein [Phormidium tenue FACHB-886]